MEDLGSPNQPSSGGSRLVCGRMSVRAAPAAFLPAPPSPRLFTSPAVTLLSRRASLFQRRRAVLFLQSSPSSLYCLLPLRRGAHCFVHDTTCGVWSERH